MLPGLDFERQGAFVIVACAATAVWAGILAASNFFGSVAGTLIYYAEIGRSLAWILALSVDILIRRSRADPHP